MAFSYLDCKSSPGGLKVSLTALGTVPPTGARGQLTGLTLSLYLSYLILPPGPGNIFAIHS